jgi:hypothetical protein
MLLLLAQHIHASNLSNTDPLLPLQLTPEYIDQGITTNGNAFFTQHFRAPYSKNDSSFCCILHALAFKALLDVPDQAPNKTLEYALQKISPKYLYEILKEKDSRGNTPWVIAAKSLHEGNARLLYQPSNPSRHDIDMVIKQSEKHFQSESANVSSSAQNILTFLIMNGCSTNWFYNKRIIGKILGDLNQRAPQPTLPLVTPADIELSSMLTHFNSNPEVARKEDEQEKIERVTKMLESLSIRNQTSVGNTDLIVR